MPESFTFTFEFLQNTLNQQFGIAQKSIKYQDVIIPIFKHDFEAIGLTVMDGPFCSIMPRGNLKNEFLLYHVKNSVLKEHVDISCPQWDLTTKIDTEEIFKNSEEFYPFLNDVKITGYNRTIRAIYDNVDDARISELYEYNEFPNYFTILSGKITTAFQTALTIKNKLQGKNSIKIKVL